MDLSYFLAQVMGLYFLIVGLAMLLHPAKFKGIMKGFQENKALVTYSGVIGLILGLLLVIGHNYWMDWPVIITIISWLILLKALFRLFFLDQYIEFSQKFVSKHGYYWKSWIFVIIGLYLGYMGFFM